MSLGGFIVFGLTGLQALFLDAFFSFIAFLSNIMAIIFAKYSKKKNSAYPTGMYFLEPLYGIIKALLIFTLLISSTLETSISAYNYWTFGAGEAINILPVLPYSVAMVALCFGCRSIVLLDWKPQYATRALSSEPTLVVYFAKARSGTANSPTQAPRRLPTRYITSATRNR